MVDVVELVWSAALTEQSEKLKSPIAGMLSALLPARTLCFSVDTDHKDSFEPFVSFGAKEVMPGLTLADILFEELSMEITDNTVVLFEPREGVEAKHYRGRDVGSALGRLLIELSKLEIPTAIPKYVIASTNLAKDKRLCLQDEKRDTEMIAARTS